MPRNSNNEIIPKPQPSAPLTHLPHDLLGVVTKNLSLQDIGRLSQTCTLFHASFQENMLQQAVLDGDIPVIKKILDVRPQLLLQQPKRENVIISKLTRKKIKGEVPFAMALKTRQIDVIKVMLPYLRKVDKGQEKALALWDEIDTLPVKSPYDFKSLIEIIVQETFENSNEGKLSDATEQALEDFRNSVLPVDTIALDDDYDVLGQLYSALKAYVKYFFIFMTKTEHHDLYCTRVYGFLQSLLQRENAAVFCHGLHGVVERGEAPASIRAVELRLVSGESFYHSDARDLPVLGWHFWCDGSGRSGEGRPTSLRAIFQGEGRILGTRLLKKYCSAKASEYDELKRQIYCDSAEPMPQTSSGCVIV